MKRNKSAHQKRSKKTNQKNHKLPNWVKGRLASYTAAASLGAFGLAQDADGAIVYTDVPDTTIGLGQTSYINLDNGGYNEFAIAGISGINQLRFNPYNVGAQASKTLTSGAYYVESFAPGALIGPASAEAGGPNLMLGNYNTVGVGNYVGMKWDIGGGDFLFGWARVDVTTNNGGEAILFSYAYENTPNTAIEAGAIPEPTSLALLAAGGGALALARRRRNHG